MHSPSTLSQSRTSQGKLSKKRIICSQSRTSHRTLGSSQSRTRTPGSMPGRSLMLDYIGLLISLVPLKSLSQHPRMQLPADRGRRFSPSPASHLFQTSSLVRQNLMERILNASTTSSIIFIIPLQRSQHHQRRSLPNLRRQPQPPPPIPSLARLLFWVDSQQRQSRTRMILGMIMTTRANQVVQCIQVVLLNVRLLVHT
jgi:hypothetical protein